MTINTGMQQRCDDMASRAIDICRGSRYYLAAAESLTGGLLADAFVRIPGASDVFLGSSVTYDIAAKASILKVNHQLLAAHGAVHPRVAEEMALGTARLYTQYDYEDRVIGMSTTGVAGPGPDGDDPAGLVYIGLALPRKLTEPNVDRWEHMDDYQTFSYELHLDGDREQVRRGTVVSLLARLNATLLLYT